MRFRIVTLEGDHIAGPGDMIIHGIKGEIYPCKRDIFDATYEPAEGPSTEFKDGFERGIARGTSTAPGGAVAMGWKGPRTLDVTLPEDLARRPAASAS